MVSTLLKSAATATTNPDPNTLTTVNPYPTTIGDYDNRYTPIAAWTTQSDTNSKAIIHRGAWDGQGQRPVPVLFKPSAGVAATYDVTVWMFQPGDNEWVKPANTPTKSYTGDAHDFIENPGMNPIFIEVSNISAGNVDIYYAGGTAQEL